MLTRFGDSIRGNVTVFRRWPSWTSICWRLRDRAECQNILHSWRFMQSAGRSWAFVTLDCRLRCSVRILEGFLKVPNIECSAPHHRHHPLTTCFWRRGNEPRVPNTQCSALQWSVRHVWDHERNDNNDNSDHWERLTFSTVLTRIQCFRTLWGAERWTFGFI
jgi:hypothetical protein